ncbi:glycosyl transferase [Spirochaetia bacterium]|nr:glycosyl transferase [Spirochaetia bacterium]
MKVAIIHYWLVNVRGGEKVLEALLEMFPQADVYTHVYDRAAVSESINSHKIYTSYIQKLPLAKKLYQKYMPLMPNALKEFDLQDYDLVISSESGPAKGVVPNPDAFHICYCHSPMRYLWDMYHEYFRKSQFFVRFFMKRLVPGLRLWDVASSNLVDHFVANSGYVAKRIRRYYNRQASVVFPPVNTEKYIHIERKPEDFYLLYGQITSYKRLDIAAEACIAMGKKLIVAGLGAGKKDIKKYEKSGLVQFIGFVSDEKAGDLLSRARALLYPGIEDFGIIPVEAQSAGCPVIAYRKGGVMDSVKENVTGIFFDEQNSESLIKAMEKFEKIQGSFNNREIFTEHVKQFSKENFVSALNKIIEERKHI